MRRILLLSSLMLAACNNGGPLTHLNQDIPMSPITEAKQKLTFTCMHETIPEPSTEADVLFQYARWLQKNNQLKQDKTIDAEIERLYRIAAENEHYKANINLQNGAMRGKFKLRGEEHLRLSQQLIDAGVATGYYFIGVFLKSGSAGLKQDTAMSLRYFRKAADQGNAQAQYYVGDKLDSIDVAPGIAIQMYRCSAEQGNGEAAIALGIYLKHARQYLEAIEVFQMGVVAGDESAAGWLEEAFRGPAPSNKLYYLGQQEDLERAERYEKIWRILANYSYADPKVPEINDILPLPPAKLPAWDGKLQWLEARLANVPPEKPSEALIHQLAQIKLLDPATGHGMPGSPAFSQSHLFAPNCYSGQICPVSGYWKVGLLLPGYSVAGRNGVQWFEKGEILPMLVIERYQVRSWPFSDKITQREQSVEWSLLS
ncbi:SEL1-like repeat protein [Pseudomonas gorinensis]